MEESWVLLRKDMMMSSSPPTPWCDMVHELQSWQDGFGSDAEMQLLLPPFQWLYRIPPRAASGVLLPLWTAERWLGRVCFRKQLPERCPCSGYQRQKQARGEGAGSVAKHDGTRAHSTLMAASRSLWYNVLDSCWYQLLQGSKTSPQI